MLCCKSTRLRLFFFNNAGTSFTVSLSSFLFFFSFSFSFFWHYGSIPPSPRLQLAESAKRTKSRSRIGCLALASPFSPTVTRFCEQSRKGKMVSRYVYAVMATMALRASAALSASPLYRNGSSTYSSGCKAATTTVSITTACAINTVDVVSTVTLAALTVTVTQEALTVTET